MDEKHYEVLRQYNNYLNMQYQTSGYDDGGTSGVNWAIKKKDFIDNKKKKK